MSKLDPTLFRVVEKDDLRLITPSFEMANDNMGWTPETVWYRSRVETPGGKTVSQGMSKFWNLGSGPEFAKTTIHDILDDIRNGRKIIATLKLDGCFDYETSILLPDGSYEQLGKIVNQRHITHVMGYDHTTNTTKPVRITHYWNNGLKENWLKVTLDKHPSGRGCGGKQTSLIVTDNHQFYDGNKYVTISSLKKGDGVYYPSKKLNHTQYAVIMGSMLGDSSIPRSHYRCSIQGSHKKEHLGYVKMKRMALGDLENHCKSTISGYGSAMEWYGSIHHEMFDELRELWYPYEKKVVPQDLSWMNDIAIAMWYMDDGSLGHSEYQQDRALFATNSFSKKDVDRLGAKLNELYGVTTTTYESKGWCLRINTGRDQAIDAFWQAISPYVPRCMQYKLPQKYRTNKRSVLELQKQTSVSCLQKIKIKSIKPHKPRNKTAYDLETETHNFFARGILVHNSLLIRSVYKDKLILRTRGSFSYEHHDATAPEMEGFKTKYPRLFDTSLYNERIHLHFEWVTPNNQIVVRYEQPELYLLGAVQENHGGVKRYLTIEELQPIALDLGIRLVEHFEITNIKDWYDFYQTTIDARDIEGYVLRRQGEQKWDKVKAKLYLAKHALKSELSFKKMIAMWIEMGCNKSHEAILAQLEKMYDEETVMWALPYVDALYQAVDAWRADLAAVREYCESRKEWTRKDYAIDMSKKYAADRFWFGIAMVLYEDGEISRNSVRTYMERFEDPTTERVE